MIRHIKRCLHLQVGTAACALHFALASSAFAAGTNETAALSDNAYEASVADGGMGDNIIVTGRAATYNNSAVTPAMLNQQPPITSTLALIDNLPGVTVNEGDAFGFDDWSTTYSVRGFQNSAIGTTIDGLPNGGSGYGGGAKSNRFIDTMNVGTVEVSQGTADVGSLSNEALGGTLNFVTSDPLEKTRSRFSASLGNFDARRFYARYDTGDLGGVKAWISASHQEATDWMGGSAQNRRDHAALKFQTDGAFKLTGYVSYDDTHEDNYDQVYSPQQYAANPESDGTITDWTGVPFIDQVYRRGLSTLRKNFFTYLKGEISPATGLNVKVAGYYHKNSGRGDSLPPYIVNVTNDGAGNPESELGGSTVQGGPILGQIYFVDGRGVAATPIPGCVGALTAPYGGTTNPVYDPACYGPGAVGVQSYRHTHYGKQRWGMTGDVSWETQIGEIDNRLRAGLWYEDGTRRESRDWHKIIDARVSYQFDHTPYWTQYSRRYPQDTFKWFVEEQVSYGPVTANVGVKQFINHIERNDLLDSGQHVKVKSKSDALFSGGLRLKATGSIELFAGYAENFRALSDALLERPLAYLDGVEPETSKNIEVGARYNSGRIHASATYFKSKFDNQIIFLSNVTTAGHDYLAGDDGRYFNAGGIDSEGFELLANVQVTDALSLYGAYTYVDASYKGTGNAVIDTAVGVTPGNRVAGIPKSTFVLSADWNKGPFRAGISGKFTGRRYVNQDNSWVADNYFLTDAYIGVRGEAVSDTLKDIDLSVAINNLTNENYLGGIGGNFAWIGAPRSVVFTLTADF